MNKTGLQSALIAFVIATGGALMTLFNGESVSQFSDIPETAYATAIIAGILAGATQYKARMADKPKGKNEL